MIAPAKLNLCLFLGPTREDGLHELCSIFQPLQLADRITVRESDRDEVHCAGVEGPNLADRALAELRTAGWQGPPVRVDIDKRIPVAAGLGGGSADAAAVLRLAAGEVRDLATLAAGIGADVTSQIDPSRALVRGSGELLEPLPAPGEFAVVLIPDPAGLSTPDVYREADRLGLGRSLAELDDLAEQIRIAASPGVSPLDHVELLENDLAPAAISLRPDISDSLQALLEAGAEHAMVTGSGPTCVGLFRDFAKADAGASALGPRYANAIVSAPQSWI